MATIENGGTAPNKVGVNGNGEILALAKSFSVAEAATQRADSYSLSSGIVTLGDATEQGVFFLKNNEIRDLVINRIRVNLGPSTGGVTTDITHVRIYKNPSAGTLISEANAVEVNSNRNFGSTVELDVDEFKGDGSSTVTDGTVHNETFISPGSGGTFSADEILPNGKSLAITVEPNDSNTNMKVLVNIVCFLTDPNSSS